MPYFSFVWRRQPAHVNWEAGVMQEHLVRDTPIGTSLLELEAQFNRQPALIADSFGDAETIHHVSPPPCLLIQSTRSFYHNLLFVGLKGVPKHQCLVVLTLRRISHRRPSHHSAPFRLQGPH